MIVINDKTIEIDSVNYLRIDVSNDRLREGEILLNSEGETTLWIGNLGTIVYEELWEFLEAIRGQKLNTYGELTLEGEKFIIQSIEYETIEELNCFWEREELMEW